MRIQQFSKGCEITTWMDRVFFQVVTLQNVSKYVLDIDALLLKIIQLTLPDQSEYRAIFKTYRISQLGTPQHITTVILINTT